MGKTSIYFKPKIRNTAKNSNSNSNSNSSKSNSKKLILSSLVNFSHRNSGASSRKLGFIPGKHRNSEPGKHLQTIMNEAPPKNQLEFFAYNYAKHAASNHPNLKGIPRLIEGGKRRTRKNRRHRKTQRKH